MRLNKLIAFILIGIFSAALLSFTFDQRGDGKKKKGRKGEVDPLVEFRELVTGYRADCKKGLKPYRYSFGRTTYFNYKSYRTKKEIEVSLPLNATYKFNFNASGVTSEKITVRVYNKSNDYSNRFLLFEKKNVGGNSFSFTSSQLFGNLKEQYRAKGYSQEKINAVQLNRIFIEYVIPASDIEKVMNENTGRMTSVSKKGAIVFASGYENLEAGN